MIELLKRKGIPIFASTRIHARAVQDYFDGGAFAVSLTYFVEQEPLGTAPA
jgi:hypothetical protein